MNLLPLILMLKLKLIFCPGLRKNIISVLLQLSETLHLFSDDSGDAYTSVSYLQTVSRDGEICVPQALAKSKVAPAKTLSISR